MVCKVCRNSGFMILAILPGHCLSLMRCPRLESNVCGASLWVVLSVHGLSEECSKSTVHGETLHHMQENKVNKLRPRMEGV